MQDDYRGKREVPPVPGFDTVKAKLKQSVEVPEKQNKEIKQSWLFVVVVVVSALQKTLKNLANSKKAILFQHRKSFHHKVQTNKSVI